MAREQQQLLIIILFIILLIAKRFKRTFPTVGCNVDIYIERTAWRAYVCNVKCVLQFNFCFRNEQSHENLVKLAGVSTSRLDSDF